jgi:hypothetical protein
VAASQTRTVNQQPQVRYNSPMLLFACPGVSYEHFQRHTSL